MPFEVVPEETEDQELNAEIAMELLKMVGIETVHAEKGHIAKPIDTAILYATINRVIKQKKESVQE